MRGFASGYIHAKYPASLKATNFCTASSRVHSKKFHLEISGVPYRVKKLPVTTTDIPQHKVTRNIQTLADPGMGIEMLGKILVDESGVYCLNLCGGTLANRAFDIFVNFHFNAAFQKADVFLSYMNFFVAFHWRLFKVAIIFFPPNS